MSKLPRLDSSLSSQILRKLRHVHTVAELTESYDVRVWLALEDLVAVDRELRHTLALLPRARTTVSFVILIKQYVIGWATLRDVYANVLNVAFDLGISEKHVDFLPVIQNSHVKKAGITEIFSKHANSIQRDNFQKLRNDIVHRGRLSMPEVDELRRKESDSFLRSVFEGEAHLQRSDHLTYVPLNV